jgi:16S rRNA C967 or C1407 C5-methylase (RsmB/RsmF family)
MFNNKSSFCDFVECELESLLHSLNIESKKHKLSFLENAYEIKELDKTKHKELKEFLIRENDIGISRQELVAMLPVYMVDIEEDYIVLDMCASPGNKSLQVIELMSEKARLKGILARGVLIANELNPERAQKLVHLLQTQPSPNVIVTESAAQNFPFIPSINYDVVFCDVPCSGDGTARKNTGIRKTWKPYHALRNHEIQITILENSLRLCKDNGYIVYSTCSMDPIENEAVVAYILEKYRGHIELLDVSERLNKTGLKYSPGMIKWKVATDWKDKIEWIYDYSQVKKNKFIIRESMFHDTYTKKNFQNNVYFVNLLFI